MHVDFAATQMSRCRKYKIVPGSNANGFLCMCIVSTSKFINVGVSGVTVAIRKLQSIFRFTKLTKCIIKGKQTKYK